MRYRLLKVEIHKLQDGSPGNDNESILEKLLSLEVADVQRLSKMPDFRILCKRRMKLMWASPKRAKQSTALVSTIALWRPPTGHIVTWATAAFVAADACRRMCDQFEDGFDSNWAEQMADGDDGN